MVPSEIRDHRRIVRGGVRRERKLGRGVHGGAQAAAGGSPCPGARRGVLGLGCGWTTDGRRRRQGAEAQPQDRSNPAPSRGWAGPGRGGAPRTEGSSGTYTPWSMELGEVLVRTRCVRATWVYTCSEAPLCAHQSPPDSDARTGEPQNTCTPL
ncbi:hypothetical protein NDU88_007041 [Pleurodeles waltl]|uniref:Uncharacterized protein n=1 Tax=Pleurodeles waltl TaxID=8319 RepID=A0AAV7LTP2_PLEWA|nr:hypothetical protein NDU88_007041 [Pleurodeles waltl]